MIYCCAAPSVIHRDKLLFQKKTKPLAVAQFLYSVVEGVIAPSTLWFKIFPTVIIGVKMQKSKVSISPKATGATQPPVFFLILIRAWTVGVFGNYSY